MNVDFKELKKNSLKKLFDENNEWKEKQLKEIDYNSTEDKIQIIWILSDWVKEGKYLSDAVKIAKLYQNDENPISDDEHNRDIVKGNDVRYIYTVRGTLPYLLANIVGQFNTDFYPDVINIMDKLLQDKNAYVRMHSIITLRTFSEIIYATKKRDGTPFDFEREKVLKLAFRTLKDNHNLPRILEFLTQVFNNLRRMSEIDSKVALEYLIFSNIQKKEYNLDYVLSDVAPLLIYYAEFRNKLDPNFNTSYFQNLLVYTLKNAPDEFRRSIAWHFWKTIEDNKENLDILKKYLPHFFESEFGTSFIQQLTLLVEYIAKVDIDTGIDAYERLIKYIYEKLSPKYGTLWLSDLDVIIPLIVEKRPDKYIECLKKIVLLAQRKNIYISNYQAIFLAYLSAPTSYKKSLMKESKVLYLELKKTRGDLQDFSWQE